MTDISTRSNPEWDAEAAAADAPPAVVPYAVMTDRELLLIILRRMDNIETMVAGAVEQVGPMLDKAKPMLGMLGIS